MGLSKRFASLLGCLLGAAALTGCTLSADVSPPPIERRPPAASGSVTVRWTIASSNAPLQCAYYRVDSLALVVYDASGATVVSTNAPCEAFNVSVDLAPGLYHADATLVDVNQRPRSLTLPINNIRITTGTDLAIDIDFPARSML